MKWSKKDLARWAKQRKDLSDGHSANNLEQDRAWEQLKQKLEDPKTLAVLRRLNNR